MVKRRYFHQLKEARGLSDKTIDKIIASLRKYEDFTEDEDFARFGESRAVKFKRYLEHHVHSKGHLLSLNSRYQTLRAVENFFRWLITQPGHKSRLCVNDIEFLQLDKKSVRAVHTSRPQRRIPTLEYVLKLIESIDESNEISLRDKALISFTLISGMRDGAIVSLPLGAFNETELTVNQSPSLGVLTKFSKANYSRLMVFDERLLKPLLDWVLYLKKQKHYSFNDPLFPSSKQEFAQGAACFISENVDNRFWSSAGPMRQVFIKRTKLAGIEYFPPHSFRHLATHIAVDACETPLQIRAVSQNLGHENIGTTLLTYGQLDDRTKLSVVEKLDFAAVDQNCELDMGIEELIENMRKIASKK